MIPISGSRHWKGSHGQRNSRLLLTGWRKDARLEAKVFVAGKEGDFVKGGGASHFDLYYECVLASKSLVCQYKLTYAEILVVS